MLTSLKERRTSIQFVYFDVTAGFYCCGWLNANLYRVICLMMRLFPPLNSLLSYSEKSEINPTCKFNHKYRNLSNILKHFCLMRRQKSFTCTFFEKNIKGAQQFNPYASKKHTHTHKTTNAVYKNTI